MRYKVGDLVKMESGIDLFITGIDARDNSYSFGCQKGVTTMLGYKEDSIKCLKQSAINAVER